MLSSIIDCVVPLYIVAVAEFCTTVPTVDPLMRQGPFVHITSCDAVSVVTDEDCIVNMT